MAEEQEARPNKNDKEFRQTIIIGSGSTWAYNNIDVFRIHFDPDATDNLPDICARYFNNDNVGDPNDKLDHGKHKVGIC